MVNNSTTQAKRTTTLHIIPLINTPSKNNRSPRNRALEIQFCPWNRHSNVTELGRLIMGFQPYPLNKISSSNTDVSQQYQQQTCIDSLQFKKNTHYHTNVNRSIPEHLFLIGHVQLTSTIIRYLAIQCVLKVQF
jgi:hypothetical protein